MGLKVQLCGSDLPFAGQSGSMFTFIFTSLLILICIILFKVTVCSANTEGDFLHKIKRNHTIELILFMFPIHGQEC